MQNYLKFDQNGVATQSITQNEDLILSRNKVASLTKRIKSNSMTQTKLQAISKHTTLQNQQGNDNIFPKTTRESSLNKINTTNGHTFFSGKHQSLHQQPHQNQNNNLYQLNTQGNNNDSRLFQYQNSSKQSYLQSPVLLSPSSNNQQFNMSFMGNNSEEIQQLKATLQNLVFKEEDILRGLIQRSNKLNDIVSIFGTPESFHFANENDFTKFREAVQDLSLTLVTAAKNEIELGSKSREIEKLSLENKHLIRKLLTLKEKCQEQQKVNELISQRNKQLLEENNKFLILLNTEKKDNRMNTKKVSALEKRVEFILENEVNITLNPNDKLRQSLNELLRENESLKRDLAHKNQEIERNVGNIKRMNDIITRLNSKLESMKKDPSKYFDGAIASQQNISKQDGKQNNQQGETYYVPQNAKLIKNDDIDLFTNFVIPSNLDFRIVSLKSDHQNLILDLVEVGGMNFTKQIMSTNNQGQQRDVNNRVKIRLQYVQFNQLSIQQVFNLIANQFLSFKELSEKVNYLLNDLQLLFFQDNDMKEVIPDVNASLARIFNAQTAHIWFVECQQGILTTFENGKEKKCLISKGLLSESFFGKKPINSKNARNKPLYYQLSEDKELQVMVDTCLIIPIFEQMNNQVKVLVEISNSKNEIFSFDEEYLSIILGQYLNNIISMQFQIKSQEIVLKFNQQLIDTFDHLMYAENKFDLAQRVQKSFAICFGITNYTFYYVEDNYLVKYESPTRQSKYSLKHGLAGQAAQDQKPYIISDVKLSSYYNKLVDLQSILPIFAIPLLDKENIRSSSEENPISACLGVIQIALKQKYKSTQQDILIDASEGYFGLEEMMSTKVQQFCSLVVHAIKQINKRAK